MVKFAFFVLPHFENDGVQVLSYPTDRAVLFGQIRALIEIVWVREDLLHLFKSDPSFWVCP